MAKPHNGRYKCKVEVTCTAFAMVVYRNGNPQEIDEIIDTDEIQDFVVKDIIY